MKELIYKDVTYLYKIKSCHDSDDFYVFTEFYSSTETTNIYRRKYLLFGPKFLFQTNPKLLFTLNFSIEDPYYLREEIKKALDTKIERLNRFEEIKNGNIV